MKPFDRERARAIWAERGMQNTVDHVMTNDERAYIAALWDHMPNNSMWISAFFSVLNGQPLPALDPIYLEGYEHGRNNQPNAYMKEPDGVYYYVDHGQRVKAPSPMRAQSYINGFMLGKRFRTGPLEANEAVEVRKAWSHDVQTGGSSYTWMRGYTFSHVEPGGATVIVWTEDRAEVRYPADHVRRHQTSGFRADGTRRS